MIVEDDLPKEIIECLKAPEFDDEAGIVIDEVTFTADSIQLRFSFRYYRDETLPQPWQLTVNGVIKERIVRDWTQHIAIYRQHPLLLDYIDAYAELYFRGTTDQHQQLFIDIYQSLLSVTGNIAELNEYDYPDTPESIATLSRQEYGLFARGSKTILQVYHQCLSKYGIHSYFLDSGQQSKPHRKLQLLEIGGSYIIGEVFHFEIL